jgi:hypothetical protein
VHRLLWTFCFKFSELGITDIDLENVAVNALNFKLVITIINAVQRS